MAGSSGLMFSSTARIKEAVALINALDGGKFPRLLSRVLQKLHLKNERTFLEEEEEKLQAALGLKEVELELVIETCEFILLQAAYHTAKPSVLSQQLAQLGVEEDKVNVIVGAWQSNGREVLEKLRHHSISPKQLTDIKWRLNLQMAQATQANMKVPNAMFELGVTNDATQEKEKIHLEFTHEELFDFYNQLETAQKQIDSLS